MGGRMLLQSDIGQTQFEATPAGRGLWTFPGLSCPRPCSANNTCIDAAFSGCITFLDHVPQRAWPGSGVRQCGNMPDLSGRDRTR